MLRTLKFYTYLWSYLVKSVPHINKAEKLFVEGDRSSSMDLIHEVASPAMVKILDINGAKVNVRGLENINPEKNYLFVSNHQGNMDIPLIYSSSPVKLAFIAKKEMEKIPLLGKVMKLRGCIFLDRDNPRKAIKSINEGIEMLKNGENLVLFPEGTRSKRNELGEFKAGGLRMAIKSKVDVIPVTINGSYRLMEGNKGKLKPADVILTFGEPVDVSNYKDAVKLTEDIKRIIERKIKE